MLQTTLSVPPNKAFNHKSLNSCEGEEDAENT
jgi:hypothetical protein